MTGAAGNPYRQWRWATGLTRSVVMAAMGLLPAATPGAGEVTGLLLESRSVPAESDLSYGHARWRSWRVAKVFQRVLAVQGV
jgi:hypothetical protein